MVDLLQAADNPHICSGKSLVSGLRSVPPLPSSGRTHLAVQLTVGDPLLLTRFWPEIGKLHGQPAWEIHMSTWK